MNHLLIVEDDRALGEGVRLALQGPALEVKLCHCLADARVLLKEQSFDLIVLDINLPDGSGLTFLQQLRQGGGPPIILLTANDLETDIVAGLELGADDYITKPFSLAVLLAKTQALIRRSRGGHPEQLICGAITVDTGSQLCMANGQPVKLPPRDYALLCCLLRNRGQVLSRSQLLDKVWGLDFDGDDRTVDVRIRSLRAALGSAGAQIKTVYKTGYRLEEA